MLSIKFWNHQQSAGGGGLLLTTPSQEGAYGRGKTADALLGPTTPILLYFRKNLC